MGCHTFHFKEEEEEEKNTKKEIKKISAQKCQVFVIHGMFATL